VVFGHTWHPVSHLSRFNLKVVVKGDGVNVLDPDVPPKIDRRPNSRLFILIDRQNSNSRPLFRSLFFLSNGLQ